MAGTGVLQTDSLFVGLTRNPMFLGVSYMYVMVNMLVCMLYFIYYSDFRVVIVAFIIHMIGYVIYFKEPLFIEIWMLYGQKCSGCRNKLFHGANSYDVY
jgi:type IV secretion system protein VirB3